MATTTNYGWTTPDDTALVKDGAAAIRTLGSSVDTTTKNLNPSTTLGDIEYRSSTANVNTRLPLGTAGQVLKVNSGATAPEWATDASGMTNPMTTTGDTIYSSSGSTPARLGIGSTGQVLTVAAGVPSWATASAGAMTKIARNTFSTAATVDVDNVFTSTYWSYVIKVWCWQDGGVGPDTDLYFRLRYGGTTQASGYSAGGFSWDRNDTAATAMNSDNSAQWMLTNYTGSADNDSNYFTINISGVAVNGRYANFHAIGGGKSGAEGQFIITGGRINDGQNWDGFRLLPSSGTIAGGYEVYGLQK
jgi:hypothetical protein